MLLGMLTAGATNASSFAQFAPAGTRISPSIIFLGTPAAAPASAPPDAATVAQQIPFAPPAGLAAAPKPDGAGNITRISPSVIALGLLQPEVDLSRFAAIDDKPRRMRNPHLPPMVIRGGLSGDVFAHAAAVPESRQQATAQKPAPAASASASAPTPNKPAPRKAPDEPPPAIRPMPTAKVE